MDGASFYVQFDKKKYVISETFFKANLLARYWKNQTQQKWQHKTEVI